MIDNFKNWFMEVQEEALAEKRRQAKAEGDETQWKRQIWKSPDKNRAIKEKFDKEGRALNYRSRPSNVTGAREWLYDFVWRRFDEEGNLQDVPLAMEIEMSDRAIKSLRYDFNKLLMADSSYRIFVFQLKSKTEVLSAMEIFRNSAMQYQAKVEADVLICGWVIAENQFRFLDFSIGQGKSEK